jgi:ubiquinone/menaquinone biosynthesis C-methylase UbiE
MTYQLPLAYLLGLEGLALLRAYAGEHGRTFTEARIAEIRRLLDTPALAADGVEASQVSTVDGYEVWSRTYDDPGNGIFAFEEPYVRNILATIPPGTAVDAACGSGRWSAELDARGHRVTGVDSSPEMLALARTKVPAATFHQGDLHRLPVPDSHADVLICALALTHVADLKPVFTEFTRVLRPGGHIVITDVHHETVLLGSMPKVRTATGSPALLPAHRHRASDYLAAALPQGLELRSCQEPRLLPVTAEPSPTDPDFTTGDVDPGPWDVWPWSLQPLVANACSAAQSDVPATVIWHFRRPTP